MKKVNLNFLQRKLNITQHITSSGSEAGREARRAPGAVSSLTVTWTWGRRNMGGLSFTSVRRISTQAVSVWRASVQPPRPWRGKEMFEEVDALCQSLPKNCNQYQHQLKREVLWANSAVGMGIRRVKLLGTEILFTTFQPHLLGLSWSQAGTVENFVRGEFSSTETTHIKLKIILPNKLYLVFKMFYHILLLSTDILCFKMYCWYQFWYRMKKAVTTVVWIATWYRYLALLYVPRYSSSMNIGRMKTYRKILGLQ